MGSAFASYDFVLPWKPGDLCICGSGIELALCCWQPEGFLRKRRKVVLPRPPITGIANAGCYLSQAQDCSKKLSREHYISKALLERLPQPILLTNLHWLEPNEVASYPLSALTARILCDRHNNALSPLDVEASLLFDAFLRIGSASAHGLQQGKSWHAVSGELIELWLLKTACGLFYSGVGSANGVPLRNSSVLNCGDLPALFASELPAPCGLYIRSKPGTTGNFNGKFSAALLSNKYGVSGIQFVMSGIELVLIISEDGVDFDLVRNTHMFRPGGLAFQFGKSRHNVVMTWPRPASGLISLALGSATPDT